MLKKVMIIDDNEMDLYVAKRVMDKYSFAEEVVVIDSAKDALNYLVAEQNGSGIPDLILLDINMPEMNGFEFLEAYTLLPERIKRTSIIMMLTTSMHALDQEKAGSNPYVRSYLNKPLDEKKLNELRELLKDNTTK